MERRSSMKSNKDLKKQTVFKDENGQQINETESVKNTSESGLEQNIAGMLCMLCYVVGFVTGIIFLLIEKENRFVRFHAFQSTIISSALLIVNIILTLIPIIGWIISLILVLFSLILWILLLVKAYKGELFKLPIVGDIAEQQAKK